MTETLLQITSVASKI